MRYFFGFLVIIVLVILTFILVLKGFKGTHKTSSILSLPRYSNTSTVVQFTDDGEITANDTHQGVRVIVGENNVTFQVYQGYQNRIILSRTLNNNQSSYYVFLSALQLQNYTVGNNNPALANSSGYCPQGDRYSYQIINGDGSNIQNYWSTSCGGMGTFGGNAAVVQDLFEGQVPEYSTLTSGLSIL